MLLLLSSAVVLLLMSGGGHCQTHTKTLLWTVKSTWDGSVEVQGAVGDPEDWVYNGVRQYARSYFSNPTSRAISRRVALAFQYGSHRVFFSDKGFKEIFRITLQVAPYTPYTYNVSLEVVYGGISTQVNGMSMDWASGSLYWTDALYNWITVANASDYQVHRRIIHTGFSRPMGIAVYPQKGLLFWSVIGAVPKIQRSTLDGANVTNLIDVGLDRPLGVSIDYATEHLYWVDDLRDTVECVDLNDLSDRWTIHVGYRHSQTGKLFGLAVYNDFIFVTDQVNMAIQIYNKTSRSFIRNMSAVILDYLPPGIPYDILMYDSSQQENFTSGCEVLGCSDICISDGGKRAHCICQEGYYLSPVDDRTCFQNATFRMPQYIYSFGQTLCGTDVISADQSYVPSNVNCFFNMSGHEIVTLGFNAYAGFLYFSDSKDKVIHRMMLTNDIKDSSVEVISANTGLVSGISVDWIADNIYWTEKDKGVIMVSRLTGRYSTVLVDNIDQPMSIAVNPLDRTMYWVTPDTIYIADMDGNNTRIFIRIPGSSFDGIVLDIRRDLLYWVDQSLPGIRSCHLNGSGLTVVLQSDVSHSIRTFTDVTVYQNYIAWTEGLNTVYFGVTGTDNSSLVDILRGLQHDGEKTSHDIITYDFYLQPLPDESNLNPCDVDNDVAGCDQLCLVTSSRPAGHRCLCSAGFRLGDDGTSCVADHLTDNFLLFVDPYQKAAYQYDLNPSLSNDQQQQSEEEAEEGRLRGIDLRSSSQPSLVAFHLGAELLFWFDEDVLKNGIKDISIHETVHYHTLATLSKDVRVERIDVVNATGQLLYTDSSTGSAFLLTPSTGQVDALDAISGVNGATVAVDDARGCIFWFSSRDDVIYWCDVSSGCRSPYVYFEAWSAGNVQGLTVALNRDRELILWTADNEVYAIRNGKPFLLLSLDSSPSSSSPTSFTSVAVVGNVVYYATTTADSVYEYDTETKETRKTTIPRFSVVTDLKAYCSKCAANLVLLPLIAPDSNRLGRGPIAGIAIGCVVFFLLLLLLLLLLVLLRRRRQKEPASPTTVAFTNDTYDRLSSVVASSLSRMPEGAHGLSAYDYYDDDAKKGGGAGKDDKILSLPGLFADHPPPLYSSSSDQAEGGEADYFTKGSSPFDVYEKHGLPFPEVFAVDLPPYEDKVAAMTEPPPEIDSSTVGRQQEVVDVTPDVPQEGVTVAPEDLGVDDQSTSSHL